MKKNIRAAIIGGSGFTGLELIKLLSNHSFVDISLVTSNSYKDKAVVKEFPSFFEIDRAANAKSLYFHGTDDICGKDLRHIDVIFLCLPPLESMAFMKKNLDGFKGAIIDIGSDFRLNDPENYKKWYGKEHELKKALPDFVYGLPEVYRENIIKSRRIANPGCYPTSVLLALAPVLIDKGFTISNVIVDSKSGVSGAGRKMKKDYLYCGINENFFAYSALMHRHIGEIEQEFRNISGVDIKVCFTPHLLPVSRGIFTSVYCNIGYDGHGSSDLLKKQISHTYREYYRDCMFVRFLGERIPQLKDVTGTNYCQIGIFYDERTRVLKAFSTIDNLLKGAAGQAVQNMNLIFNLNEGEALYGQGIFS